MITSLSSWSCVVEQVARARNAGALITNFFADEQRMTPWCLDGSFEIEVFSQTWFFLHRQSGFTSLYFFTPSAMDLTRSLVCLQEAHSNNRFVVDVIGAADCMKQIHDAFQATGFSSLAKLQRMARKTPAMVYEQSSDVQQATLADGDVIYTLLQNYFNPMLEQLPTRSEVMRWIEAKSIYVVYGDEKQAIAGFVIFDLTKVVLYLRYWFVHPDFRNQHFGAKLLKSMFFAGAQTKRQYFWVFTDNENAIVRYKHYGFEFEPMTDVIWANH